LAALAILLILPIGADGFVATSAGAGGRSPPLRTAPTGAPLGRYAFTSVTVVPMDRERSLDRHTVVVESGRITAVGPDGTLPLPADATVIDGTDHWLMPGLVDFHTHERALRDWPDDVAGNFLMYLANGVTSIVNMGDFTGAMIPVSRAVRAGELAGPEVYVGQFVRGPRDGGTPIVSTPDDARAVARRARTEGYDFLKVYDGISRESFDALAAEGRALRLPILGHVVREAGLAHTLAHGQVMVVHTVSLLPVAFQGSTSPDRIPPVASMFLEAGAALGATLYVNEVITGFGLDGLAGADQYARVLRQEGVEYMDDAAVRAWKTMLEQRADIRQARDRRAGLAFMQVVVKAFHDAGVPVLLGSDEIGIPGVVPGFSVHGELRQLREAGLTPFQALATGTRVAGQFIRRHLRPEELIGVIAAGARADLVLLRANPLADVGAFRKPAGVMAAGRWYPGGRLEYQLDSLRTTR
jgi:imidazolonepropionase-like amidohydrolase